MARRDSVAVPPDILPMVKSFVPMQSLPLLPLVLADVPSALRRALDQEGVPSLPSAPGAPQGRFVLFDSRRGSRPQLAAGQTAIDIDSLRAAFANDPFADLDDLESRQFRWQVGAWSVSEEVARCDKRAIRRKLMRDLRAQVEQLGGVWLCLSAYPYPYRSAFNFRFDHDSCVPGDFAAALRATSGNEGCFTHFISGAGFAEHLGVLRSLSGCDVGSHGYWHHTYADAQSNLRNIRRGVALLEAAGLQPYGFAAPHGRYTAGLHQALVELQMPYSSEFAVAYDELPLFVDCSGLLQVPVHPVCLGLLLEEASRRYPGDAKRQQAAAGAFERHLAEFARAQYAQGEPIFVYGHPDHRLGRWPQVIRGTLSVIGQFASLWKTSLGEFSRWWRARANVQLCVTAEANGFRIHAEHLPAGWRAGVEYWRGEHVAPMPLSGAVTRFAPAALGFQRRRCGKEPLRPVRMDGAHGLRGRVRRMIDWERVTPLEEIDTSHWRGRVKHALRRLRP